MPSERSPWRAVAVPSEHGGWGLTLEPVLLGLLVAFSWSGLAIGAAAFVAFLVRTPLKLVVVDRRRHRSLPRTRLATRIAAIELAALGLLGLSALWAAGATWLVPVAVAVPLVAVELWFDIRSRGRRLIPELAGACGITAVAAAIIVADDGSWRLAIAAWMVLAARAIASIPYVRAQIVRTRRGSSPLATTILFQLAGAAVGFAAIAVDNRALAGAVAVAALATAQTIALQREHIPPVKVIGLRQMAAGFAVVAATAVGVLA
ncbi:MAG: YwiC-like family protein [Ilumatobacter sp.]|uniref:YwiC-like family protein n=1 Tax=Ilumatobacter sp. TaxID=1967498 RepID=UPI00391D0E39